MPAIDLQLDDETAAHFRRRAALDGCTVEEELAALLALAPHLDAAADWTDFFGVVDELGVWLEDEWHVGKGAHIVRMNRLGLWRTPATAG